jgi:hypothetical protein
MFKSKRYSFLPTFGIVINSTTYTNSNPTTSLSVGYTASFNEAASNMVVPAPRRRRP